MKVKVGVPDLQYALRVTKDVGYNAATADLNGVLISAKNDRMSFVAISPELGVRATVAAEIKEEGVILAKIAEFNNVTLRFKPPNADGYGTTDVLLVTNDSGKNLSVSAKTKFASGAESSHKRTVGLLNRAGFPSLPEINPTDKVTLPYHESKQALTAILFAMSSDKRVPVLNSVHMSVSGSKASFACTDGIAVCEATVEHLGAVKDFAVNLPVCFVQKVIRSYTSEDEIVVGTDGKMVYSNSPYLGIFSPLIYGDFPDYKSVFTKPKAIATFEKEVLVFNVFSLTQEASEQDNNRVDVSIKGGSATIVVGESTNDSIQCASDSEFSFSCNLSYLSSCIKSLNSPNVIVGFNGPGKPVSFVQDVDSVLSVRSLLVPLAK